MPLTICAEIPQITTQLSMKKLIASFLADFKWYRKRQGGKWYKVFHNCIEGGFQSPITCWTQNPELYSDTEIIKEEKWLESTTYHGNKNGNTPLDKKHENKKIK